MTLAKSDPFALLTTVGSRSQPGTWHGSNGRVPCIAIHPSSELILYVESGSQNGRRLHKTMCVTPAPPYGNFGDAGRLLEVLSEKHPKLMELVSF